MMKNAVRTFLFILILLILSLVISLVVSSPLIQTLNNPSIKITPDNFVNAKSSITDNSIVEIEGTINPYNLVGDNNSSDKSTVYYAGLSEYGNNFIVKFKPNKLITAQQKFIGKIVRLGDDAFSNNLINAINSPINSNPVVSDMLKQQFDTTVVNKIADYSKANYDKTAILILDGEFVANQQIYLNVIISFIILSALFLTLFRKKIFKAKIEHTTHELDELPQHHSNHSLVNNHSHSAKP